MIKAVESFIDRFDLRNKYFMLTIGESYTFDERGVVYSEGVISVAAWEVATELFFKNLLRNVSTSDELIREYAKVRGLRVTNYYVK